ncbi:phytanoyl-CoA dioxygenase family protein [Parvibaculum sp.]|uniref:phytanoyl-CoA dioxygenase family protein n=1 Tax=Parvibaculum sp. TaxID=2024848 RepID=UPI002C0B979B|nr:phytanoyl-CoA dioxygenase family protein [Parvibaculum sp.]HUD50064.1 phytanoyl-CoA dioxygenase family protein [Parvibaculum sp.]
MTIDDNIPAGLSDAQVAQFMDDGFVRMDGAFSRHLAEEARAILWRDTGCDPDDPATWTKPVIRLGQYVQEPFVRAASGAALHDAFDRLAGKGRWHPRMAMGTFPVRFPSPEDPGDTGWHIDVSFGTAESDFFDWRANIVSRGRALLLLFLFSDVGEDDAPTRLRVGSHLEIARRLAPAGEEGLTLRELAAEGFDDTADCAEALATGEAGTVYLCHPFLVHAAQPHRGTRPRFIAQPPLLPAVPFSIDREDGDHSPVEQAIRKALGGK